MSQWFEPILDSVLKALVGEGERFARAKAIAAGIRVIRGVRGLLLVHYLIQLCTFLCALSFMGGGMDRILRLSAGGKLGMELASGFLSRRLCSQRGHSRL